MKVMVVGGAGFLGSHLVDILIEQGHEVFVVDDLSLGKVENLKQAKGIAHFDKLDVSDLIDLGDVLNETKPQAVYNLAVMPLPHSLRFPTVNIDVNIKIATNLLECQKLGFFDRLIHFSSSEVYGSALYTPMCENHPLEASTPYAAAKAACDLICLSYHRTFGNKVSIIRPFNNYGPRQNAGSYAGIIPLTINRIKEGKSPIIHGNGLQTRDYIYVKDTVRAAAMLLSRTDLDGEIINIASGQDVSILKLVRTIQELMTKVLINGNYETEISGIIHHPARPGDVRRHIGNVLKAKDLLRFEATTPLREGLIKTIEFYIKK